MFRITRHAPKTQGTIRIMHHVFQMIPLSGVVFLNISFKHHF
jgi:hypothetical protein